MNAVVNLAAAMCLLFGALVALALVVVVAAIVAGAWRTYVVPRWRRHHPYPVPAAPPLRDRQLCAEEAAELTALFDLPAYQPSAYDLEALYALPAYTPTHERSAPDA
jgi:hypothetical protein